MIYPASAGSAGAQDGTGIHLPVVEADAGTPTGVKTTWSCVLFGSYPSAEVVDSGWDAVDDYALQDGDRIEVEIRSIDRNSYDYLYSMQVMDNAGTNPIQNFTGGCLGYFSAYHVEKINLTFRLADIEEE